jgi:hypothetical protein
MQAIMIGSIVVLAVLATSANAAAPKRHEHRRAEVISMGQPPATAPGSRNTGGNEESHAASPAATTFAVHDLRRRWIAFQMAGSFADAQAAPMVLDPIDPFAPMERASDGIVEVPRAAILTVPPWMRGVPAPAGIPAYQPNCAPLAYRPTGFLRWEAEQRRAGYYAMMSSVACEHGLPVGLFDAMIIRESQYRPDAFSLKNAFGLTQLMPGTAAALGVDRYSIEGNLRGGARYLRQQLDRFGQYHLALAAYNAGPGRVREGRVPAIAETRAYVDNVLANWSRLSGFAQINGFGSSTTVTPLPSRRASVSTF